MEPTILKPSKMQRALWLGEWAVVFLIVLYLILRPMVLAQQHEVSQMFGGFLIFWLILMLPLGIWIPFYYSSIVAELYTSELHLRKGVVKKQRVSVPLDKIARFTVSSNLIERLFGIERLKVYTGEGLPRYATDKPAVTIPGLIAAESVGELLTGGKTGFAETLDVARGDLSGSDREILQTLVREVRELRRDLKK